MIGFCLVLGLKRGLINELLRILGVLIAVVVSFQYYQQVAAVIEDLTNILFPTSEAIAFSLILVCILAAYYCALKIVVTIFAVKLIRLVDKAGGLLIGTIKGILIGSAALVILFISPLGEDIKELNARSLIAPYLVTTTPKIYDAVMMVYPDGKNFISRDFFEAIAAETTSGTEDEVPIAAVTPEQQEGEQQ